MKPKPQNLVMANVSLKGNMPDPKSLKVGDKVKFISIPDVWEEPGCQIDPDDIVFMRKLIEMGQTYSIAWIDEYGNRWIELQLPDEHEAESHSWAISESIGWKKIIE